MRYELVHDPHFSIDPAEMRRLVQDLNRPLPSIYWTDLLLTTSIAWAAFLSAAALQPMSPLMLTALGVAVFAFYRALAFMHEITHQSRHTLPGFETAWNWLVGFPLLMPSFMYTGVHQDHHRIASYGTSADPEYLPFAHSTGMTVVFALESFLIPLALLIRFLVLAPVGFASRRFQRWLAIHASALTMNLRYRRNPAPSLVRRTRYHSMLIFALWAFLAMLLVGGVIPGRIFFMWLAVDALISFVNTLRTLGAHAYENEGEPLDRTGQLIDSIDTPGALWTELWAPIGLRYHALHHYFPGIPYHNLPRAYRRVIGHLPVAGSYGKMSSTGLARSLATLLRKGRRQWHKAVDELSSSRAG